ncbi:MAG: adenosine deaminase [Nocardioides sp.]|jgi:hypothetical protein|uniref:hypothetical protein n=1 Tax=Nocardioides sp. TaxID=35761 RepID=UPI00262B8970|nr:hypothetical protein [Nocardioides sp.]MCW2832448.1 adenosine deaminase [Nocardioides sp.]
MSNHDEGDFGQSDRDAAERATAEINLEEPSATDDVPWSPPDRQPRGAEMAEVDDESLSMRLMQEEPDPTALTEDEGPFVGGDDPDAIAADQDVLGGDPYDEDRVNLDDERGPEAAAMHLE